MITKSASDLMYLAVQPPHALPGRIDPDHDVVPGLSGSKFVRALHLDRPVPDILTNVLFKRQRLLREALRGGVADLTDLVDDDDDGLRMPGAISKSAAEILKLATNEEKAVSRGITARDRLRAEIARKRQDALDSARDYAGTVQPGDLAGAAAVVGGGAATPILTKKMLDKGHLTGRETMYHGTDNDAARLIRQHGLKVTTDASAVNTAALKREPNQSRYRKSLGKTYLTNDAAEALEYAHNTAGKRNDQILGGALLRPDVVKVNAPTWKFRSVMNPEVDMPLKDWYSRAYGAEKDVYDTLDGDVKRELQNRYNEYRKARVFEHAIPAEYIKGSKYKRLGLKELGQYIANNKLRFGKGLAGPMAGVGLAGLGAGMLVNRVRDDVGQGASPVTKSAAELLTIYDLLKQAADYDFSSVQVELPPEVAEAVRVLADRIPDEDLYLEGADDDKHGRIKRPHVTVKYGLHTTEAGDLRGLVSDFGETTLTLGKTSLFERPGSDYDVVKIEVESPDLHRLNKLLCDNLETTDTFPDYEPHATVAYVKKGRGKAYAGLDDLEGRAVTVSEVTFSPSEGQEAVLQLT